MKNHFSLVRSKMSKAQVRWICLLSVIFLFPVLSQAQINPLADQYLINQFQINPGVAGSQRYAPVTLSTRQQWMGFIKAPTTQSITIHTTIGAKDIRFTPSGFVNKGDRSFGNIGVGGGAFKYSYGAISHTGVHFDYAYHVFIGKGRMGFGLAPVIYQFTINKDGFTLPDGTDYDPLISNKVNESLVFLDANVGAHYYDEFSYAGFSIIQLLNSTVQFGTLSFISEDSFSSNPDLASTYYLYYGRYIKLGDAFTLEPSAYLKYNTSRGVGFHVNTMVHILKNFTAGLTYRHQECIGLLAGARLDNIEVRYMFEAPISSDMPNNFTTHQIMVQFVVGQAID